MAFEKAKVLKAAEKFLSQGKINAAIKEYRQIVDHDDEDFTTLNMLGDLYVRANKKEEAISCFERIAEHYSAQEFNLKAIAMYKKVERLRPRDPGVALKLADLYAVQGLIVDARAQYLVVADAHNRTGENRKALEILHRIADLDPNNTDIRLKLADGYLKENLKREAASAYLQAANRLYHIGSYEQALEAYNKALTLFPDDVEVLRGLLETHIARGTADDAAEVLETIVADRQHDKDLVSMLARAYLEAEDPKGAEKATSMLMRQDASNYTQFIPVAQLYLKAGEIDEAVRVLSDIIERMLAGREEKELLEIVTGVLERNPDHVSALRMLVRIYWWQRDMDALRSALERLAEAAEAAELIDEERYALTQLVRLAPDEQRYLNRLNVLGGLQEETVEDLTVAEPVAEVPEFETFIADEESTESVPTVAPVEFETNEAPVSDPRASFADLNELADDAKGFATVDDYQEVNFETLPEPAPIEGEPALTEENRVQNMMRQELESLDFYIAQGYTDIAIDTLEMLERQFGQHPEFAARRQTLGVESNNESSTPAVFEFGGVEEAPVAPADESVSLEPDMAFAQAEPDGVEKVQTAMASPKSGIDAGLAELFEEFRTAEEGDVSQEDFETHYNMGTAYKEMDLMDEAIQEFQAAAALVRPADGTPRFLDCCNMLGHCFMQQGMPQAAVIWFKKGLGAPGYTEDAYQALRYELATAYEQLGDLDNARHLYTEVYGIDVSYREVADKLRELKRK